MSRFLPGDTLDPPPFECVEGDSSRGVLLLCDHASAVIPARHGTLGLGAAERLSHVVWDIGAAAVTRLLAGKLGATAVLAGASRLVIDCNRHPGDPSSIPARSCNVVVPGNQAVSDDEAADRAERWFWPYHRTVNGHLAAELRHGLVPVVVSVHSFTPSLAGGGARPWHVGVLWNRDPRVAEPLMRALAHGGEWVVGDNQPYSGREINYTLDTHAGAAGLPHVSVEIRQDLVADDAGCIRWAAILAEALAPIVADPALRRTRVY